MKRMLSPFGSWSNLGVVLACVAALGRGPVYAVTYNYTGTTSGTFPWSTDAGWGGIAPVSAVDTVLAIGTGGSLTNGTVINANNDVASPFSLNSLTFAYAGSGADTNSPKFNITGGALNFVSDGVNSPTLVVNATGTVTGTTVNTIPVLNIQSGVMLTDNLTISTTTSVGTISGIVSGGGTLTKTGAGTFLLAGANTYTGQTIVNVGTLAVGSALALGDTLGNTVVNSGGALGMQGGVTITGESLTINGDGASSTIGALRNISGTNTWAGSITVGAAATTRVASTLASGTLNITGNITLTGSSSSQFVLQGDGAGNISGNISGTARLTRSTSGSGTWKLSGVNTYTETTTISGGTLQFLKRVSLYNATTSNWTAAKIVVAFDAFLGLSVGGADEFTAADIDILQGVGFSSGGYLALDPSNAGAAGFTYAGSITNTNLRVNKIGTGSLTLSGNNQYGGSTLVSSGTLRVASNTALGTGDNTATTGTTVNSTTTIELQGGVTVSNEYLTIVGQGVGNAGALRSSGGSNTWNGGIKVSLEVVLLRVATATATDTLTINGNIDAIGGIASGLVFQGPGVTRVNGVISGTSVNLTRSNNEAGYLVLAGANTYTGTTAISNGFLQVGVAGVGSLGGTAVGVNGGTLAGTGSFGGLVTLTSGTNAFIAPGDSFGVDAGTLTFNSGLTLSATGGAKFKFNLGTSSDKIIISGGSFTGNTSGVTTFQITPGSGFDNGIYDLIDWTLLSTPTNVVGVDLGDFAVSGLGAGKTATFQFDVTGKILQLNVVPEPGRAMLIVLSAFLMAVRRRRCVLAVS